MIRLHHVPQARSFRTLWLLEEIGLDFEVVEHSFFDRSLRDPAYLDLSPAGRVPALEIEGRVLFESGAIAEWLCETEAPDLGARPGHPERADWLEWLHYAETIGQHVANLTQQHIVLREDWMRSPTVMRLEAKRLESTLEVIDRVMDRHDWLLPSGFSAVGCQCRLFGACRPAVPAAGPVAGGRGMVCAAQRPAGVPAGAGARRQAADLTRAALSGAGNLTQGELLRKCNPLGDWGHASPGKCFECDIARARPNRSAIGVARSIGMSRAVRGHSQGPARRNRSARCRWPACAVPEPPVPIGPGPRLVPGDPAGGPGCDRLLRAIASGAYRGWPARHGTARPAGLAALAVAGPHRQTRAPCRCCVAGPSGSWTVKASADAARLEKESKMDDLLRKPRGVAGKVHDLSPADAGWSYVGFDLYRLTAGETSSRANRRDRSDPGAG